MVNKRGVRGIQIGITVAITVLWEISSRAFQQVAFFVGSPFSVMRELLDLILTGGFFYHFLITGSEALAGFFIGTSCGTILGLTFWYSKTIARIARPFVLTIGTVPVFAFAPLLVVWFGVGLMMKIVLASLTTFFIAFTQAFRGATLVSGTYLDMLDVYEASNNSKFFKIVLPGSIDWVLSSLRLNVGFALLGAFLGEFISSEVGLGRLILRATGLYNVSQAIAATVGMVVLAFAFDTCAAWVERHRHALMQLISVPRELRLTH